MVAIIALAFALLLNKVDGISAFIGGFISILSNMLFATLSLYTGKFHVKPNKVLSKFYFGETIKLVFTVVIFTLVMQNQHLAILPLLFTYLIVYISFSFMGLFFIR